MRFSSSSLLRCSTVASLVLSASAASAHIGLSEPLARAEAPAQGNVKSAPCGQTTDGRTSGVTVFKPGDVVTVNWVEYVNHPSYFRVAFQPDGDTFPMRQDVPQANNVPETAAEQLSAEQAVFVGSTAQLLAVVQDNNTSTTATLTTQVTLPNVTCENCTLQIVQVMYNNPPQDGGGYYQCADIAIRGAGGATDPSGGAGAAGAANSGAAGSTSVASGGTTGAAGTTGTSASGGATSAATGGTGGNGNGNANGGPSGPSTPSAPVGSASNGASSPAGTPAATGSAGANSAASAASTSTNGVGTSAPATAAGSSDDGGGCSFEAPSGARTWALWGLAPAALIFARRLRRRSARS